MCGIAGYFGQGDEEILRKMTGALARRGPDDQGFYLQNNVGLGHRRLSIIDLKTGRQPVSNETKDIWVILNGEIYNFKNLREELRKKRHSFYTQTDTEIIVHLYEEKGDDFLKELNGMFALALWDAKRKKIILARDRLGEKPLYYSLVKQTLIFGSELKALLEHFLIKKEIDCQSLAEYLVYEYTPAPRCIFKNIFKLEPGEYLTYQDGKLKIEKYWQIKFGNQNSKLDVADYLNKLDQKLNEAIRMRLVSDVPLGIFLSGGLDSSTIAYYAQKNSLSKIKTFSIGFADQTFDESVYARQMAEFLNSEHYEKILTPQECLDLIPRIVDFLDEPLADASIVPTYLLAQFAKQKVKVALSGDGGDELFMGYPTFQAHKLAGLYQLIPRFLRVAIVEPIIKHLPVSLENVSFDFKLKKFISGINYPAEIRNQIWLGSFSDVELKKLLNPQIYQQIEINKLFNEIKIKTQKIKDEPLGNKLIYLYLKNYLQDDILVKTDRATMAVGLESRAPFLDHALVELVNSLPNTYKLRGWQTKYILKKLMKDKLPQNIICRSKKGFGMPIAKWIREDLKSLVLDIFAESEVKKEGFFNYSYIKQLLKNHFDGYQDNRKLIWTLMIFELWRQKWAIS